LIYIVTDKSEGLSNTSRAKGITINIQDFFFGFFFFFASARPASNPKDRAVPKGSKVVPNPVRDRAGPLDA
jgi:hypothetical protein